MTFFLRHQRSTLAANLVLGFGLLLAFCVQPALAAPPGMPPKGHVILGLGGHGTTVQSFNKLTRAKHGIYLITTPWNEARSWNWALDNSLDDARRGGYRLMVHIGTTHVNTGREARTPADVALGKADRYFLDMSRVMNESDQFIYLRPPAEMNGHWNDWAAYNKNGSRRNAAHSTRNYRKAFIRMTLIGRGGSVASINKRLKANGMPTLKTSVETLPSSGKIATVFNPQGRGAPDVSGNQPWNYYPGRQFVDYVANDIYVQSGSAAWDAHEALYNRYKGAYPFIVGEYAPWGYDDPAFMSRMFAWSKSHKRTVALIYFNGTSKSTFKLSAKPKSLAKYRKLSRSSIFRCDGFSAFETAC